MNLVSGLLDVHPGREELISQLSTLLTTTAPPCIHIHTPFSPKLTTSLVRSILAATRTTHACLNSVECLSPRIVFDRVLLALADWQISWKDGCMSFGAGAYSSDLDAFIDGLREVARMKSPGTKFVLTVDRAEKFKENVPDLMVPFTRLAELSALPVTTIYISEVSWFDLRPSLGTGLDPFIISVPGMNTQDSISSLINLFPDRPAAPVTMYSTLLKPLYAHYIAALHSVCAPFVSDLQELSYLAAACWPGFVSPVLAEWQASTSEDGAEVDLESLQLPNEDARIRLVGYFTPAFSRALETLYPRTQHAAQWIAANAPLPELRVSELSARNKPLVHEPSEDNPHEELTTIAKFVLVAAFLASVNPAKWDARMVGRAAEEGVRRRRGGGVRRVRGGGHVKIPPRIGGPAAFPLDRLIAIVGSLMEEHDSLPPDDTLAEDDEREKDVEMDVGRIQVSATISDLAAMRLLHRTTPADKLDGPPTFKCGVSQAYAFKLARDLGITNLGDMMWDQS